MTEAENRAIDWLLRLPEADAETWDSFTRWLEASAAHRAAYDRIALIDAEVADRLRDAAPVGASGADGARWPAPDQAPARRGRGWLYAMTGVAAVAASVAIIVAFRPGDTTYTVTTAPGEQRVIALADGSEIALNGGSRVKLDRGDPRAVALVAGEASVTVRHDPRAPFEMRVGESTLRDIGTRFDVRRLDGVTEVAVAQGAVLYNSAAEAVTLAAGDTLRDPDGPAAIERGRVAAGSVGGWRLGQLSFDDAPLTRVAHDIALTRGLALEVAPALADRRFTGTIAVNGDRGALLARLRALLDVAIVRRGAAWRFEPGERAAR